MSERKQEKKLLAECPWELVDEERGYQLKPEMTHLDVVLWLREINGE